METVRNPLVEIKQEIFDEILKTEPNYTFHDENQSDKIKREDFDELLPVESQDLARNELHIKEEFIEEEFEYKHVIAEPNSSDGET